MRLFLLACLLTCGATASAQTFGTGATDEHRAGVGVAATIITGGISGIYDVTDELSAQAILGAIGTYTSVGGRALYRFSQTEAYDIFGYGGASLFSTSGASAIGLGGGAGIEVNWARVLDSEDFPPLYSTFEVGLNIYTGDDLGSLSFLGGGGSLHYRF